MLETELGSKNKWRVENTTSRKRVMPW